MIVLMGLGIVVFLWIGYNLTVAIRDLTGVMVKVNENVANIAMAGHRIANSTQKR